MRVEPMAGEMYSRERMRDAVDKLQQKLVEFLQEPAVEKAVGTKDARGAVAALRSPVLRAEHAEPLGKALSFLLATRLRVVKTAAARWSLQANAEEGPTHKI